MPPKAALYPHLTIHQLKHRYRQAPDISEARRWQLLHLVAQDWTIKRAAQAVDLNYDYAKEIIRRYNQEGPETIQNRSQRRQVSPRSLLTAEQVQELKQVLQQAFAQGEEWTGPQVARWIAEKTGRSHIWPQRGWDYLRRLKPELPVTDSSDCDRS